MIKSIAKALDLSAEVLLSQAAGLDDQEVEPENGNDTEAAIKADSRLTEQHKQALLQVYRGFVESDDAVN